MIYLSTDRSSAVVPHLPLWRGCAESVVQDLPTVVQIQPKNHPLDQSDFTVATRQQELDHTITGGHS